MNDDEPPTPAEVHAWAAAHGAIGPKQWPPDVIPFVAWGSASDRECWAAMLALPDDVFRLYLAIGRRRLTREELAG